MINDNVGCQARDCNGCNCSCRQAGTHPKCNKCNNCTSEDAHTRK